MALVTSLSIKCMGHTAHPNKYKICISITTYKKFGKNYHNPHAEIITTKGNVSNF
jgi:hypothetical protein